MGKTENLDRLALEKYGSWKSKVADIQYLNTRLFYDTIRQKRTPATRIFSDLVSNYDLVYHSIDSLSHQRVDVPIKPIIWTFTAIQNITHLVRTSFGESKSKYGGDT